MKRTAILLSACVAAALAFGCASNENDNEQKADQQPKGTLMGNAVNRPNQSDPFLTEQDPPVQARTFFAAGQFAEAEGNYAAAAKQYESACKIQPDYLWAEYRLGVVYSHQKDWPKAIAAWNNYIESSNQAASAYSNLGFTYELMGDWSRAEEAYQKGIARDSRCHPCRVNYGLLLARKGRIPDAVQQFAVVLSPAEIHYNLASVFEQQGRTKLARAEYEMALKLDPKMKDAQTRMAAISFDE